MDPCIQKKIIQAVTEDRDPFAYLTRAEMKESRRVLRTKETRAKESVEHDRKKALDEISKAVRRFVSSQRRVQDVLVPGAITIDFRGADAIGTDIRYEVEGHVAYRLAYRRARTAVPRRPIPKPVLAFAAFAKEYRKERLGRAASIPQLLLLIEETFPDPWPGANTSAQKNSLKAALRRVREADQVVVKLRDPKAIRRWAKSRGEGYPAAAEAMVGLLGS